MVNQEYAIAYTEVLEILKYISKEDFNKIPSNKINLWQENCDKNYIFNYNPTKTLAEQNVSKRAKAIIGLLFRDYWATPTQKEKIIARQEYERNKLEEEKKKRYSTDIFKDTENEVEKTDFTEIENSNLPVKQEKENIFRKIINYIKRITLEKRK